MRDLPADYGKHAYIPWYGLIAKREGKDSRWIDTLFKASKKSDRLEFVWESLVKPMLSFHSMVQFENGIVTELHQQNALFKVDLETMNVIGLGVRDMDGHRVDFGARKALRLPSPELTIWNLNKYGYADAWMRPMLGYEYLKDSSIKNTFGYFLKRNDLRKLVRRSNDFILDQFNAKYSDLIGPTQYFSDLPRAFEKLNKAVLSQAESNLLEEELRKNKAAQSKLENVQGFFINRYYKLKQRLEGTPRDICRQLLRGVGL